MTGFHRIQSGSPLVFTMGTDVAQNGILNAGNQYALLAPGATADTVRRDHASTADMIAMYFNTAAFVPLRQCAALASLATPGEGSFTGRASSGTDLAILRSLNLGSDLRLQLRGEFFNAFNQVNFNNPNTTLSSSTFGRITGAGDARVIQVAAKIIW